MLKKSLKLVLSIVLTLLCGVMTVFAIGDDVEIDVGNTSEKTYSITELGGKYKVQGRSTLINNLLMTDYSASGIEFSASCEGTVKVTFNASSLTTNADGDGGCYFTVIVDGVKKARDFLKLTATGDTTVTIAEGLTAGKHTFEIYRQTEIERATVGIKSITLKGSFYNAPKNNDMYIEFIGDSITTAYGNLTLGSTNPVNPSYPLHQDATQGYAYLTAKALGADWSIVARQGIGAVVGYQPVNMQTAYPLLRHAKDQNTPYDFARQPDVVVIGLGANDMSTYLNNSMTLADVKKGFSDMFDLVHEKNPDAKIVWVYGWIDSSKKAGSTIKEVIAEKGGEEKGFYTLEVDQNSEGANGHSYYTAHAEYAKQLSAFINEISGEFIPGDIDNNGSFDLNDISALAKYVAGWEPSVNVAALDPNGDSKVDLKDVTHLARVKAGWSNVTISDKEYKPNK